METYIVAIYYEGGQRKARRFPLNIPLDLATGHLERLSDLQVREARRDLNHEYLRREGRLF
jgi:hypothetical protein